MADFEDANCADVGEHTSRGSSTCATRCGARSHFRDRREELRAATTRPRRCSFVRAAGISPRSTSSSTASRCRASLFDFGLYFFHNAKELLARGTGPYFYLPKMESHLEARLWNDVFVRAQQALGIPDGTIRATVLIETILAAFEMDEILYELREHSAGLNCGRWDYIFSFIKKLRARHGFITARPRQRHDGQGLPGRVRRSC